MPDSFYCLDNDIILKLATYDLFNYRIESLNIEENQVKILDTFKYKFGKPIRRNRGNRANIFENYDILKALEITQQHETISEKNFSNFELDIYTKLINYSQISKDTNNKIDKGEAILISYVCCLNQRKYNNYLLTGDKNCLRALSNSGMTDIIELLQGKVWCLEQLILKNIEQFGFHLIQSKIYPKRNCDTNLKLIFGYSEPASENTVKESLNEAIKRLKEKTKNLIYPYPNY